MDNSPSLYVERPLQPRVPQHQQYSEEKDTIDLLKYWRVIWLSLIHISEPTRPY